jgi:hypothetical protein
MGLRAALERAKCKGLFVNSFLASLQDAAKAVEALEYATSRLRAATINTIIHSTMCTDFNFPTV